MPYSSLQRHQAHRYTFRQTFHIHKIEKNLNLNLSDFNFEILMRLRTDERDWRDGVCFVAKRTRHSPERPDFGCDVSIAFLTFDDSWLKHLSEASQGLAGFGIRRGSYILCRRQNPNEAVGSHSSAKSGELRVPLDPADGT